MDGTHQYISRHTGRVCNEPLFSDRIVRWLYHPVRENAPQLFRLLTGAGATRALGFFNYDLALSTRVLGNDRFLREAGVDLRECLDPPEALDTARKVFERKIRYWECRPLATGNQSVVYPADARVIVGSLGEITGLNIKDKFFSYPNLLGEEQTDWLDVFRNGDFALFRLTPDKYHYNHTPVAGEVIDYYVIDGRFHSCNPQAIIREATPCSKNRRVVTIIDTDVAGGTGVGIVAMVEIVALMIGEIVQCYSARNYDDPQPIRVGMFLDKGCPKSLYRQGSSTDLLLFEKGRINFAADLLQNRQRRDVLSRFTAGFHTPLVETDIKVRSFLGATVGVMPVIWGTSLLCILLAALLRWNQAVVQLANCLTLPLHISLFVPFFIGGERFFATHLLPNDTERLTELLSHSPGLFLQQFWQANLQALVVWGITTPLLFSATFLLSGLCLKRLRPTPESGQSTA
ncbi:MAG: phosphatidylserine decarboxylase [Desulfuromonas sp.]|nr:MAG: phosphatidylserine decarboxylase [Desulfuromonas sp.]